MSKVRAAVILDIDESDEERLKANAEQFLEQALVEKAPSEEVGDNAVRDKPVIKIEDVVQDEEETRDVGEPMDYEEAYDGPLDLISKMKKQLRGTDLNSVGWSIFKPEYLQDLDALEEMIEECDSQ